VEMPKPCGQEAGNTSKAFEYDQPPLDRFSRWVHLCDFALYIRAVDEPGGGSLKFTHLLIPRHQVERFVKTRHGDVCNLVRESDWHEFLVFGCEARV
jgi:hypothetical protein